jgi:hypothetical protein
VGLVEVALLLELHQLVAHGGRGHADAGRVRDVAAPHGSRGLDVLLDHGLQDRGLAVFEHVG